jgi:hypothetical protein
MEHATMKRTLSAEPAYTPVSIDEPTAAQAAEGRSHIHYMVLPNCRNDAFRTDLLRLYDVARTRTYRRRGYSMEVLELDRKR